VHSRYNARIQADFFTDRWKRRKLEERDKRAYRRQRSLAVFSLLAAIVHRLVRVFDGNPVHHILVSNVVDDASIKVKSSAVYDGSLEVKTMMNNIQNVAVFHSGCAKAAEHIPICQPAVFLDGSKATDMLLGYCSWLMISCVGVGEQWSRLGLPADLFHRAKIVVSFFVGDSLKANDTLFNVLRQCQHSKNKNATHGPKHSSIQIRCLVHKLNLVRRPLALCFDQFWSTQVRLGHLFESSTFKFKFQEALAEAVCNIFDYVVVDALPQESMAWRRKAVTQLRLLGLLYVSLVICFL
jgi:hypothetical protein